MSVRRVSGYIAELDAKKMQARVRIPQAHDIITDFLQILVTGAGEEYRNFTEGTLVACLLDENYEDGWILGPLYPDSRQFDDGDERLFRRTFPDGTMIEYDAKAHRLKAEVKGSAEIKVSDGATIDGEVEITGNLAVKKALSVERDVIARGSISADGSVEAKAMVKGAQVQDAIGTLSALRIDYRAHMHAHPQGPTLPVVSGV